MKLKSSEPFWLLKNGLIHSYPSLAGNAEADVVVIGGGITGSLIAHQCMHDGYHTILIDKREIANGSTSASTSMLQYEIDVPLFKLVEKIGENAAVQNYKACYAAIDTLQKLTKKIKSNSGFKKKESLYFSAYKKDNKSLQQEFLCRQRNGFPVVWLTEQEIQKKYQLKNAFGGILSEQGASVDVFKFTHDLLAFNYKKGLKVFDKTNLEEITYKKNGVLVKTDKGFTIKANKIIFCTGFESTEMIKEKFVQLLSTYAIAGEQAPGKQTILNSTLFWNTADPYFYMRTTDDNRLLMGGADEDFVDPQKRDLLLAAKAEKLQRELNKMLPHYNFKMDFAWTGTFGSTKDGLPFIGKHPDFKNAYFVLGFGGNGITFSVIGMEVISAMLKKKKHPLQHYYRFGR